MKRVLKKIRDNPIVLPVCIKLLRGLRAIGLFRSRRVYSHFPYRGVVTVDCGNGHSFRINSRGNKIENSLYWEGLFGHEPNSMALWVRHAGKAGVVLDIGANSGVFALAAAAVGASCVHAFEPVQRIHRVLAENAELNIGVAIHTWPVAVGAENGTATIYDPGGVTPTSASLSAKFSFGNFSNLSEAEVSVVTVDEFCLQHAIEKVDLIKLDVEGYEEFALRGMEDIVRRFKPVFLMEVLEGQEDALKNTVETLWPNTYFWQYVDEGDQHISRNVLLVPQTLEC